MAETDAIVVNSEEDGGGSETLPESLRKLTELAFKRVSDGLLWFQAMSCASFSSSKQVSQNVSHDKRIVAKNTEDGATDASSLQQGSLAVRNATT